MGDFPGLIFGAKDNIGPGANPISIGSELVAANAGGAVSKVWPSANLAIFIPCVLWEPFTVKLIVIDNAATVAGNIDGGIYDQAGNLIVGKGSTAMSGANTPQSLDIADTALPPGRYYIGFSCSSATATFFGWGPAAGLCSAMGILQMAAALPLPTKATFAANTGVVIPDVYMLGRTLV